MMDTEKTGGLLAAYRHWLGSETGGRLAGERQTAFDAFCKVGFPTRANEEWKYTSLRAVQETAFDVATVPGRVGRDELGRWLSPELITIVMVDGYLSRELSSLPKDVAGLTVQTLGELGEKELATVMARRPEAWGEDPFVLLSQAFVGQGVRIRVARNAVIDRPIALVYVQSERAAPTAMFPRTVVEVAEGAEARLLEVYLSAAGSPCLSVPMTTITGAPNSHLTHVQVKAQSEQAYFVGRTAVELERDAGLTTFSFDFGAEVARSDLHIALDGPGAEVKLDGLYMVTGERHVDNHTVVDHRVPHASSSQFYKGILTDRGRAVFNGKVFVRLDAQQTSALQLNKNLMLSSEAEIDTKPELQIDADDVKCSHGATVGQLDQGEIFYLESRGIPKAMAERMLSRAFADEIIMGVPCPELRRLVEAELSQRYF